MNGYRIELAEIEVVFSNHPMIEQAVAIVRYGQLAVYLKPKGVNSGVTRDVVYEIYRKANRYLTSYMMPRYETNDDI